MGLVPERPRVDHPVDRPELYGVRALQVTGTNGRLLDRFYRSPSTDDIDSKGRSRPRVTEESAKVVSKRKGCSTNRAARA